MGWLTSVLTWTGTGRKEILELREQIEKRYRKHNELCCHPQPDIRTGNCTVEIGVERAVFFKNPKTRLKLPRPERVRTDKIGHKPSGRSGGRQDKKRRRISFGDNYYYGKNSREGNIREKHKPIAAGEFFSKPILGRYPKVLGAHFGSVKSSLVKMRKRVKGVVAGVA